MSLTPLTDNVTSFVSNQSRRDNPEVALHWLSPCQHYGVCAMTPHFHVPPTDRPWLLLAPVQS